MESKLTYNIHFICTGNIYRSRLAESYLRSKKIQNVNVSSSGIRAKTQQKGTIIWYALRLLYRNSLLPYVTPTWTDTTPESISNADMVIFIGKNNYEFCTSRFAPPKKYEIWDLPDFDDRDLIGKPLDISKEMNLISISEKTFLMIKEKVDNLVLYISNQK